jgi:hypothetical protein
MPWSANRLIVSTRPGFIGGNSIVAAAVGEKHRFLSGTVGKETGAKLFGLVAWNPPPRTYQHGTG